MAEPTVGLDQVGFFHIVTGSDDNGPASVVHPDDEFGVSDSMSISDSGGRHQVSRNREEVEMSQKANIPGDRGQIFDGVKIGRPATGALVDAGYWSLSDLPEDLAELSDLHGVGPRAVALLKDARGR